MTTGGYEQLHVYKLSHELAVEIHYMTMALPKFEMYEEGSQIRRSAKRIAASIVEGYALRKYKAEYLNYLLRAYGSAQETIEHLDLLRDTGSLNDIPLYAVLRDKTILLNRQLFRFIQGVQQQHEKPDAFREEQAEYILNQDVQPLNSVEKLNILRDEPIESTNLESQISNPESDETLNYLQDKPTDSSANPESRIPNPESLELQ